MKWSFCNFLWFYQKPYTETSMPVLEFKSNFYFLSVYPHSCCFIFKQYIGFLVPFFMFISFFYKVYLFLSDGLYKYKYAAVYHYRVSYPWLSLDVRNLTVVYYDYDCDTLHLKVQLSVEKTLAIVKCYFL